jgi:uncharacterized protein (DUF58 family)
MRERLSAWVARIGAPAFRRVYRIDRALRRKLTPAGWVLAGLLVTGMVFGVNTRESLLYQLFALAVSLFLVAAVAAWRLPVRFQATRRLPRVATAGETFTYAVTLVHTGGRGADDLQVEDLLAWPRVDGRSFARYKVAADRDRNVFDRLVGYPRWVAFMRERIGGVVAGAPLAALRAGETREVRLHCTPARRGVLQFHAIRLLRPEPMGLLKAQAERLAPESLVVLPRTFPVAPLDLPGARRLQPGGVPFAGRVGDAEEFMSLRDYRAGDGPRRIHWKAWARTGRMVVKEYQEEFFVRHALVLDTFCGSGSEALEAAVSLAGSLVLQPRAADSLLDLMLVEGRAYTFTQGRGLCTPAELLRVLATVGASEPEGFTALAESVALAAHRMSGVVCVLLAWDAPRQAMVAALRQRGLPVRVWLLTQAASPPEPGPMASDPRNFRVVRPRQLAQALLRP